MDRDEITAEVAGRLVAGQFPQWAGLPVVPVGLGGWDNTTFRLGGELSVRLPSGEDYVPQVAKEHRWLPVLAARLPLPVPEPVALGRPAAGFPWPWSVYRWIEGEPACPGQVADQAAFAADLAGFLAALYAIDASGGPSPGQHSAFRGGPLTTWDEQTRTAIDLLAGDIDTRGAIGVWDRALAAPWQQPPVWVHGDVAPSNLLLGGGALHAVIDFGCAAVGDPACDLVMAWTFFPGQAAAVFRRGLPFDEATWARAHGWALWKALVTLSRGTHTVTAGGPPPAGSAGATAPAMSSTASSPTATRRPGTDPAARRHAGHRDGQTPAVAGLPRLLAQICWQTSARNSTSALPLKLSHSGQRPARGSNPMAQDIQLKLRVAAGFAPASLGRQPLR